MRKFRTFFWFLTVVLTLSLISSAAFAKKPKKKDDDQGKSEIEETLKDATSKVQGVDERSAEEKAASEADRKKALEGLGKAPIAQQQDDELGDVNPEEVDERLKEIESKNKKLVEKFEQLLQKDPTNAKAAEWMFRIAEYKWEMASYRNLRDMREWGKQLESLEELGTPAEEWPEAPNADYSESIEYYKKIVASHASYERLDEVLFKLGDGLIRAGEAKEGVGYLHRLKEVYKDSIYLDRVYLSLGEYYFENHNVGTAEAAYETIVTQYPDSKIFNYAQYKLAWTYFNSGDEEGFTKAIETFKKVVETLDARYAEYMDANGKIDENKLPVGEVSFRNQAINDLIVAYAESEAGWQPARDYFEKKLTPERLRSKMEKFAELMGEKGQFGDRVDIYRWLMSEDPMHGRIPEYAVRIIDSHFNDNHLELIETTTREFIDTFDPNGKWMLVNKDNVREAEQAKTFAEDKLYSLAATYLLEATKAVDREDNAEADKLFLQSRKDHETFLRRYPESQYAYDMNFYYAYILDENSDRRLSQLKKDVKNAEQFRRDAADQVLPDLIAAAEQYQKVIELKDNVPEDGEDHTRVSANRQVFVYANVLATVDPEWSLEASGDAKYFRAETKDSEKLEEIPLTDQENAFVRSAGQYSALFPTHEDTPGFLWRSAEIYRSRYHYNEAAQRFDELVTNFPKHEYAGQAVGSMFALYNKAENWPKIEYWAEWLITQGNFKVYEKAELEDAVGYSIGQQSEDLYEAKSYRESAEKLYTLKKRFPDRENLIAPAVFSTANIYRDGKMVAEAIDKYEEFRATYPKRPEAPISTFEAATLYAQKTDFEKAAEMFELVPDEVASIESEKAALAASGDKKVKAKKGEKKVEKKVEKKADDEEGEGVDLKKANQTNAFVALFNAVQIREGLEQYDLAVADARRYLTLNPNKKGDVYKYEGGYLRPNAHPKDAEKLSDASLLVSQEGTVFHLAEIYIKAKRYDEAIAQFTTYLEQYPENKSVNIYAHLEIAKAMQGGNQKGWQRSQEKEFAKIEKIIPTMTPEELEPSLTLIAEMRFMMAERLYDDFKAIQLEFPVRVLRKRIPEKAAALATAETAFRAVTELKVARWSAAASFLIGEMAIDFRDALRALPIPDELQGDQDAQDEYTAWLEDELIYPAEDQAIKGFEFALNLAHQLKVYNRWSRQSAARMSELVPTSFPVTNEKGVATEHSSNMVLEGKFVLGAAARGQKDVVPAELPKEDGAAQEPVDESPEASPGAS